MKVGSTIRNYKILNVLRPGAGGNVYVVEDVNTNKKFVIKSSFLDVSKKAQFEKIIHGWKNLSCKNVVEFKEFFYDNTNSYIVMEYCTGGDLASIMEEKKRTKEKFSEAEVAKIATDVLKGLQAMHRIKMIHRDLKTTNILRAEDGTYKIADFNVSYVFSDDSSTNLTLSGTMRYVAPELLQNNGPSYASDVYAVGTVLYEIIALAPAFTGMDIPSILANKFRPLSATLGYTAELTQLVHHMIALDPAARPTADDALDTPVIVRAQAEAVEGELRHPAVSLTALQQTLSEQKDTIATLQQNIAALQKTAAVVEQQQDTITTLQKTAHEQQAMVAHQQDTITTLRNTITTMQKAHEQQKMLALSFDHPRSLELFPQDVPFKVKQSDQKKNYIAMSKPEGDGFFFRVGRNGSRAVFADTEVKEGVYRCAIKITLEDSKIGSYGHYGVIPIDSLSKFDDGTCIGWNDGCSYNCWWGKDGNHLSTLRGVEDADKIRKQTKAPKEATIALEANTKKRTLSISVNGETVPFVISNIPVPCYFGISGSNSFASISSLKRLLHPTDPLVKCKEYRSCVRFDCMPRRKQNYTHTPDLVTWTFSASRSASRTAFQNKTLDSDTKFFRWTIKISYHKGKNSHFHFGAVSSYVTDKFKDDDGYTALSWKDGCAFNFWRDVNNKLHSALRGVQNFDANHQKKETEVPDGALVTLEVDTTTHTLSFFVNDVMVPHVVSKIPLPLRLGISGSDSTFSMVSTGPLVHSTSTSSEIPYVLYPYLDR